MKLPHALAILVASSCLSAGCATTSTSFVAGAGPMRGVSGSVGASASAVASRNFADEHMGSAIAGSATRDDMHVNEAATFSGRDPQFAGPTPQVPIPHDGRHGDPALW